jgi:hypothetical protein
MGEWAVGTTGGLKQMSSILLTNSALVYEPKCLGWAGGGCVVSAKENSCAHGAQVNFGDVTLYLTYGCRTMLN